MVPNHSPSMSVRYRRYRRYDPLNPISALIPSHRRFYNIYLPTLIGIKRLVISTNFVAMRKRPVGSDSPTRPAVIKRHLEIFKSTVHYRPGPPYSISIFTRYDVAAPKSDVCGHRWHITTSNLCSISCENQFATGVNILDQLFNPAS